MTDKVLSLLGLAQKAGKVQSGEYSCEMSVKKGKAALVILAGSHPTEPGRNSGICVSFMKRLLWNMEAGISLERGLEKNSGLWRLWRMKDLRQLFSSFSGNKARQHSS